MVLVVAFGVAAAHAETPVGFDASAGAPNPALDPEPQAAQPAQTTTPAPTSAPTRHKSVAATVVLSLLVPGGGNFYVGDKKKGFIVLGTAVAGIALAASSIHEDCYSTSSRTSIITYCTEEVGGGRYYGGLGLAAGANIFGLISAVSRASDINSGKIATLQRLRLTVPSKKDGIRVAYNFNF